MLSLSRTRAIVAYVVRLDVQSSDNLTKSSPFLMPFYPIIRWVEGFNNEQLDISGSNENRREALSDGDECLGCLPRPSLIRPSSLSVVNIRIRPAVRRISQHRLQPLKTISFQLFPLFGRFLRFH
jgi:hypothetical protein